jgi:AI-2 transport protein TqsA
VLAVATLANVISGQVGAFSQALPGYSARFATLSQQLGALLGPSLMAKIATAIQEFDLSAVTASAIGGAGSVFGTASMVLLYLAFLLADQGGFSRKLPLLVPDPAERGQWADAFAAMNTGVQNYIAIKTAVSLTTGGLSYIVMKLAGLNFAETWALLIFMLNFIPTIGSIAGTILPAIAALAQFPTFGPVLAVLGGVGVIQFIIGNIVEPSISGRTLNLSPFVIIVSLTFWSMVWGIPGAFLSVPLTVCGAIICSHVPALQPISILLSGGPDAREAAG